MNNVIPFHYEGTPVKFSLDGWINATEVSKHFGRRPSHWLELPSTHSYMTALAKHLGPGVDAGKSGIKLVETSKVRGRSGTWLHPKLAVAFARWLDDDFAVWCDLRIDALLRGEAGPLQEYERASATLEECKAQASRHGKGLAAWRRQKPPLMREVEYWREQMQLVLGLEEPTSRISGRPG
ncbi:KilA-N domain-containing protein [Pseudomonas sp. USHLN015]|uniref:KilA-N domain-containing protein n=1 Tax=Pseudomonas sp. USHLN015 TaxID=3081296 RepID=UPI00301D3B76